MSWVTWEPKSTIRTLSCMDGDMARTCPESGAQRPLDAAAFCGLCTAGSSPSRFPGNGTPAGGKLKPMYWPLPTGSRANVHCRALSTAGPSSGIVDIHFPMRERSCSSGLAALAGGAESGIDSGGTG